MGHPEHDILFIATQVAKAAGLKDPAGRAANFAKVMRAQGTAMSLADVAGQIGDYAICGPKDSIGRSLQLRAPILPESSVYQMLLRGRAPASEPFRKWVTEEVLPTIRKTGKYNAEDAQNPIALAIMDELKSLRGEIVSLRQELQAKAFSLEAPVVTEVSPYEGQPGVALCDPAGFNARTCIV